MGKQAVTQPYNRILFGNKNEWRSDRCYNMDEPRKRYAECKKPAQRSTCCLIPFGWKVQNRQVHRHRKQMSRCLWLERKGKWVWSFSAEWWNVWKLNSGDGCVTVNILQVLSHTLKEGQCYGTWIILWFRKTHRRSYAGVYGLLFPRSPCHPMPPPAPHPPPPESPQREFRAARGSVTWRLSDACPPTKTMRKWGWSPASECSFRGCSVASGALPVGPARCGSFGLSIVLCTEMSLSHIDVDVSLSLPSCFSKINKSILGWGLKKILSVCHFIL